MLYFLIALLVTAVIIFLLIYPFTEIHFHYKQLQINIYIKHWLIKKNFNIDLNKEKRYNKDEKSKEKRKNNKLGKNNDSSPTSSSENSDASHSSKKSTQPFDIKTKIEEIKGRIYNSDTGFNIDEIKNIKNEFTSGFSGISKHIGIFFKKTRYKIHIPSLRINLEYGTGNPANTGLIYGSAWNIVGILYPILTRYFHIAYPSLNLTPDFYGKRFDAEIKSIIKVRPAHIINAAISVFKSFILTYLKNNFNKGREKNGR